MTCQNPNNYQIMVGASTRDHNEAYVGKQRTPVESLLEVPPSVLPRKGSGNVSASLTITTTQDQLVVLAPALLGNDPVPFELTLSVQVAVDVNFFARRWRVSQAFVKDCGLAVKGIAALAMGQPGGKMSTLVCADSFADLRIPDASDMEPIDEGIHLSASEIKPDTVAQGTAAKNVGLGAIIALGFIAFASLAGCGGCVLLCCAPPRSVRARAPWLAGGGTRAGPFSDDNSDDAGAPHESHV